MQPWLQGNLVHVDLEFNFDQTDNDFYHRFDMMLDKFEHRDLQEYAFSDFYYCYVYDNWLCIDIICVPDG